MLVWLVFKQARAFAHRASVTLTAVWSVQDCWYNIDQLCTIRFKINRGPIVRFVSIPWLRKFSITQQHINNLPSITVIVIEQNNVNTDVHDVYNITASILALHFKLIHGHHKSGVYISAHSFPYVVFPLDSHGDIIFFSWGDMAQEVELSSGSRRVAGSIPPWVCWSVPEQGT